MRPRIGIIGGGRMGGTHSKAAHYLINRGLVDGELVALCETDPERRASFGAPGLALVTDDPDELIASPDVNTIYIATPTFNHRELAEKVAAAGKALFCEKPLAFNSTDAAAMQAAVERGGPGRGVINQVGLVMRYSAVVNATRSLIAEEHVGRPMTAVLVDDQFFPIQGHYASTWRGDASKVGAGTLLEHAIHDIDVLVSLFGTVRRVHGTIRNFAGLQGVEDLSNAILEFESGAVANHISIWHNILHRGSSRNMTIFCENARLTWTNDWCGGIRIESQQSGGRTELSQDDVVRRHIEVAGLADDPLRDIMRAEYGGQDYTLEGYRFLQAVSEDRPAFPDFSVAVYAHRIVDAIYQSAREGRPIDLA